MVQYTCMQNSMTDTIQHQLQEHRTQEEERLIEYLSEKYKIPVVRLGDIQVNTNALQLISEEDAREAKMAIYERSRGKLTIAANEPNNPKMKEVLRVLEGKGYSHKLTLTTTKTLEQMWEFYRDIVATSATTPGTVSITNENLEEAVKNVNSVEAVIEMLNKLGSMSKARRISKNVEYIAAAALAVNTSDIHLEPSRDGGIVRFRVDGVLTDIITLPRDEFKRLITRMKLVARMKITAKGAQDGGFVVRLSDRTISVRASIIPEEEGGSFVLRLLDPKNVIHEIESIGLHPVILDVFQKNIKRPNGLILTTGPTGSGKTTTLYSFLNAIKTPEVKIITLEDPIEYRLEGIVQTQITKKYTFGSGLRAILRQDPDIILVGEIRDNEVAEIGVQAALTGHLVFSTLHTNDALGALPRLAQLGVDPQAFSRAINIVIAQRLARVLCPHCSETHQLTQEQKEKIAQMIEEFPEGYRQEKMNTDNIKRIGEASKNCEHCSGGYKGRIGIFEVFEVNDAVEKTYREGEGIGALQEVVKKQGLPFMKDDGLWKVLSGQTSLEELERVIGVSI